MGSLRWIKPPPWPAARRYLRLAVSCRSRVGSIRPSSTMPSCKDLPFPYVNNKGTVVGYQADMTMTSIYFHVATHSRDKKKK